MSYETEQLLTISVQINSENIMNSQNINGLISQELKKNFEGYCGKYGYVINNSIQLLQRSIGKSVIVDGESKIQYSVTYKMKTIYPCKDDIYECTVSSTTKMGIVGYLDYNTGSEESITLKTSPLLIIIPNEDLKREFVEGDKVQVVVKAVKIKYRSPQIQIIAKISD
jgi:DNA-directed RNA polymerase subunit E'/Rpb7